MMLLLLAVVYGAIAALVFRRTTNPVRIRQSTNEILARIMEFRLFVDEPSLVWQAQLGALRANLALIRQIALPCLIMATLFAVIYPTLSRGTLRVGEATVLTSHTDTVPHIEGIAVETPGVRIPRLGEVSWRARPTAATIGSLPPGVKIQTPRTIAWLPWFFAISTVSALVLARRI